MKKALAGILVAGVLAAAGPAVSGDIERPEGVVELFTSQGCSSCPPADKVLLDLSMAGTVIALGYHVDYWDYLGWKDTLGKPEFTERQKGYARTFASRGVYTPQAVINGRIHVNGADRAAIDRALAAMNSSGESLSVDVSIELAGDSVIIKAGDGGDRAGDAHLVLIFFDKATDVTIERGENRGRTITYANVVTGMQTAGMWHGDAVRYELPRSELTRQGSGGCAVLLQVVEKGGRPGRILGATVMLNR